MPCPIRGGSGGSRRHACHPPACAPRPIPRPALALTTRYSLPSIFLRSAREARVIKLDFVNLIVSRTNVSRAKAEEAVETVFDMLKKGLAAGQRIELRRFGVFSVKPRKTGIGRNPRTGEEVSIPPGRVVRFKPGKELRGI